MSYQTLFKSSLEKCVCSWASHLPRRYSRGHLAPLSGRVLDQYGAKKPILFGLSLATIGWLALTILLEMPVLLGFVAGHVTYMIGLGFAYSNMMTTGMSLLLEEKILATAIRYLIHFNNFLALLRRPL